MNLSNIISYGRGTLPYLIEQQSELMSADEEGDGVYDFKDNKTTGTVTVTKKWNDKRTNRERQEPEIKISTKKPSKSTLGYTVTFHGNEDSGLAFADGSYVNEVVYNGSGEIVSGTYKTINAAVVRWYTDKGCTQKVEVDENGKVGLTIDKDIELWGKETTFEIKGYQQSSNEFNKLIPNTVTDIVFTDETKPESAAVIDVDADGDGGVVAWTENNGTVMKVSTQIKGAKVQAAKNSAYMFNSQYKIKAIDFTSLNTQNVTDMGFMFSGCSGLTSLDLTPLNTANVTNMNRMFANCSGLTDLDLTSLNTANVTSMVQMFGGCSSLTSLDLTPLNTANVTSMGSMFYNCSRLTSLDLTSFNTTKVTNMGSMFYNCSHLTSLDLTPLNTASVTNMFQMFGGCSSLTSLDLTSLNTQNVTNMESMFYNCYGLTSLNLTPLNTQNVTDMSSMFDGCSGLTSLDLTSLNTQNVTNMGSMFYGCSVTSLDLTSFDTAKVTNMGGMFGCYGLTTIKTGTTFKFAGTNYNLPGTWRNTAGKTFTSGTFPSNVADTYTKI